MRRSSAVSDRSARLLAFMTRPTRRAVAPQTRTVPWRDPEANCVPSGAQVSDSARSACTPTTNSWLPSTGLPWPNLVHVEEVGADNGGCGVNRHQGLGVRDHHRVVIDVENAGVQVSFLRSIVRVRAGRRLVPISWNWRIPASRRASSSRAPLRRKHAAKARYAG